MRRTKFEGVSGALTNLSHMLDRWFRRKAGVTDGLSVLKIYGEKTSGGESFLYFSVLKDLLNVLSDKHSFKSTSRS